MEKKVIERCCICNEENEMTFEHLPPKSIGNNKPMIEISILTEERRNTIRQQGSGMNSLCKSCNNNTGNMYGPEYKRFHEAIITTGNKDSVKNRYINELIVSPLKVFKEIICMFLSINPAPLLLEKRKVLQDFVLNREEKKFLENLKIYMYIQNEESEVNRRNATMKILNILTKKYLLISEFVSNGIGYILSLDENNNCSLVDIVEECSGIYDITFFKNYGINDKEKIKIDTKILKTNSPFTLDFRDISIKEKITFETTNLERDFKLKKCAFLPLYICYGIDSKYEYKITYPKNKNFKKESVN